MSVYLGNLRVVYEKRTDRSLCQDLHNPKSKKFHTSYILNELVKGELMEISIYAVFCQVDFMDKTVEELEISFIAF